MRPLRSAPLAKSRIAYRSAQRVRRTVTRLARMRRVPDFGHRRQGARIPTIRNAADEDTPRGLLRMYMYMLYEEFFNFFTFCLYIFKFTH